MKRKFNKISFFINQSNRLGELLSNIVVTKYFEYYIEDRSTMIDHLSLVADNL